MMRAGFFLLACVAGLTLWIVASPMARNYTEHWFSNRSASAVILSVINYPVDSGLSFKVYKVLHGTYIGIEVHRVDTQGVQSKIQDFSIPNAREGKISLKNQERSLVLVNVQEKVLPELVVPVILDGLKGQLYLFEFDTEAKVFRPYWGEKPQLDAH